ncbi:hypothetical protein DFA_11716 [Cavenderia fasciculata]|uniref:Ankyrin repeat-containing protein n=1 Tax=Cavenderia fasciculata TaxID=261658 RepID=F4QE08_CACFS|nr:uncharacterized protein DFA_11716 [Cavenderia fasciculata]EGG13955.1 hypothetical protein DFA_11716 [Cavenderia fasciculata]|eukprot:XP_004350663.1 hypothetical protein DFA_11716 [Cavenderia fasciculata]
MGDFEPQKNNSTSSSNNKSKISILLDGDDDTYEPPSMVVMGNNNNNNNNKQQSPDITFVTKPNNKTKMIHLESDSPPQPPSTMSPSFGLVSPGSRSPFNTWGPTIQLPPLNFGKKSIDGVGVGVGSSPHPHQQIVVPPSNQMSPTSSPRYGIKPSPLSSIPPPSTHHMHQSVPMGTSSPIHSPRNNLTSNNNNSTMFSSPHTQSPSSMRSQRSDSPLPNNHHPQHHHIIVDVDKKQSPRGSSANYHFKPIQQQQQQSQSQSQSQPQPSNNNHHSTIASISSITSSSSVDPISMTSSPAFESRGAFSTPFSSSPIIEPHPQYSPIRSRGGHPSTSASSKPRAPSYQLDSPLLSPSTPTSHSINGGGGRSSQNLPQLQHLMVSRPQGVDSSPLLLSTTSNNNNSSPSLNMQTSSPSLHSSPSHSSSLHSNNNNNHYHPYGHPPSHHQHHQSQQHQQSQQQQQHHHHLSQQQQHYQQSQQHIQSQSPQSQLSPQSPAAQVNQNGPSVKYRTNSQLQFEGHHSVVENSIFDMTVPILKAAYDNHTPSVKSRLQQNSNEVNYQCKLNGWTPLMLACQGAHYDVVDFLLTNQNIDVDIQNRIGDTSLMIACNNSYAGVVERLLQKGANPNIPNQLGTTPLMISCALGDRSIVLMLLNYKASVLDLDHRGFSALMYTQVYGYKVIVGNEIRSGFNGEIVTGDLLNQRRSILQILLNHGARIDTASKEDWTPLKLAIKHGPLDFVEYLIDMDETLVKKVDSDRLGWSCLNLAIRYSPVEVIDLLLKRGCSTRHCVNSTSPLLLAIQYRNVDVVSRLLHHKVLNDNDSIYPLSKLVEFSVENNKMELARYLAQQSNNQNNQNSQNNHNNNNGYYSYHQSPQQPSQQQQQQQQQQSHHQQQQHHQSPQQPYQPPHQQLHQQQQQQLSSNNNPPSQLQHHHHNNPKNKLIL